MCSVLKHKMRKKNCLNNNNDEEMCLRVDLSNTSVLNSCMFQIIIKVF